MFSPFLRTITPPPHNPGKLPTLVVNRCAHFLSFVRFILSMACIFDVGVVKMHWGYAQTLGQKYPLPEVGTPPPNNSGKVQLLVDITHTQGANIHKRIKKKKEICSTNPKKVFFCHTISSNTYLPSGSSGHPYIWARNMVANCLHIEGPIGRTHEIL